MGTRLRAEPFDSMQAAKEYLSTYRTVKFVTIRSARLRLLHDAAARGD